MPIPFKRALRRLAAPALIGVLGYLPWLAQAEDLKHIRIAVPDLSAAAQHSGGGISDVLRSQQLLEKAFAEDGVTIDWKYFKGAGPVINEAFANGQVDFAYLGDLAAIIGKANGLDTRLLSAAARGNKQYLAWCQARGSKPCTTSRANVSACSVAPRPNCRSTPRWPAWA